MAEHARDRTSRFVGVVLLTICALTFAITALVGFAPAIKARLGWIEPDRPAYVAGESIDIPQSLYAGQRTLIVFASGTCGACRRSASALGELAKELRGSETRFLLVTPSSRRVDQQGLIDAAGLQSSEVSAFDLSSLRLKIVPAVVLIDSAGRVLFSREGLVDEDGQTAIRRAVGERRS
jgi:hypothetical protein